MVKNHTPKALNRAEVVRALNKFIMVIPREVKNFPTQSIKLFAATSLEKQGIKQADNFMTLGAGQNTKCPASQKEFLGVKEEGYGIHVQVEQKKDVRLMTVCMTKPDYENMKIQLLRQKVLPTFEAHAGSEKLYRLLKPKSGNCEKVGNIILDNLWIFDARRKVIQKPKRSTCGN